MKKLLILLAVFVGFSLTSKAQFSIGPKIGVSVARLSTDISDYKTAAKTGISFGAFARFGDKTYLQPELIYNHKGADLTQNTELGEIGSEISIKTMDIPVMIGYKIMGLGVGNIRVMGGPVASFIVDDKIEYTLNGIEQSLDNIKLKNAIWGLQLGAGVDVMMFTLDVRYEIGLNDISDIEGIDLKSNTFQVSLGWKIL